MIAVDAPAKINLFLHVGPVRGDGLHELASLFVFAEEGDRIVARAAKELSLTVTGPFAPAIAGLAPENNLVWRAAAALRAATGVAGGAAIELEKRLPVAAGVGGGSADAAAALRALRRLWRCDIPDTALARLAFRLGADVPACLLRRPLYVGGAGEVVEPGPRLPPLWIALVNPRVEMPTGPIFRAFDAAHPAPRPPAAPRLAPAAGYEDVRDYLRRTRNDLEPYAVLRAPVIGVARDFLAQWPGCLAARMSGSGATVFGLFASREGAARASRAAQAQGWWAMTAALAQGRAAEGGAGGDD